MSLELNVKEVGGTAVKSSLGLMHEFREFISRGNVVDLAVGVIIGGAFGQITTSLVKDVVMPPIGYLTSGINFSSIKFVIQPQILGPGGKEIKPEVAIAYGDFINTVINFLIVSFVIFWVVKSVNWLKRLEAQKPAATPEPTAQEKLLIEIRDLLAKRLSEKQNLS
ncbi:MAG TPA: large-conductance mechanosensitive channel protein MscL [Candidatus Methylacidiphilales bacterium]|nr:large-conductance mechanosensitive channel protein MscL [Candidatus Methylacidiphilales bacterium]